MERKIQKSVGKVKLEFKYELNSVLSEACEPKYVLYVLFKSCTTKKKSSFLVLFKIHEKDALKLGLRSFKYLG